MKSAGRYRVVLVTAPDEETARTLSDAALNDRLVACANIVPSIESRYWWKGNIETGREVLILFKTTTAHLSALERLILNTHPYDTPEFIVVRLDKGSMRYLEWISNSCRPIGNGKRTGTKRRA